MPKLKETKESVIKKLYQIMYDFHMIMTNNNVKYWADAGTFLGAIRHEGIIPWDDDIDVGILSTDVKKFLSLEDKFASCGYSICKVWLGYKVYTTKNKKIIIDGEEECYSFPFLDVIVYKQSKEDHHYHPISKTVRDTWPKQYFFKDDLFPLKNYNFGSFQILGPGKPIGFLEQMYGKDWNEVAYRQYDHAKEEAIEQVKVQITKSMRNPAKPIDKVVHRRCLKSCLTKNKPKYIPPSEYWMQKETQSCSRTGNCYKNFSVKMGIYVINCGTSSKRYEKFTSYATDANLNVCRVPCVLGKKFDQHFMCQLIKDGIVSKKAEVNPIEIAISMSHYNCWQKMLNSCYDYGLVFEDDVEVKPDFIENINLILGKLDEKNLMDFSILYLWNGNWGSTVSKHKKIADVTPDIKIVKETTDYNAGGAAYIISRKFAEFAIKKFFPIKIPQDMFIGNLYKYGNHLSLKMRYEKDNECYISPLLDMECGGEGGTGTQTTQDYSSTVIERWKCETCDI